MNRFLVITIYTALVGTTIFAQSGRRVAPASRVTAGTTSNDEETPNFSESVPVKTRRSSRAERFPGIGDGTTKPVLQGKIDPAASSTSGEEETVKIETNLITIPVSVFDRNGLYIPGLKKEEFKVFENGKEQEIAYFGTSDKPFTVILMLDTSPSTAYRIEEIQAAAIAFVDQLKPQDNVVVIEFNGSIKVRTEPTNDREQIYKAIRKANFGSGTALYDAVDIALRKKLSKIDGRKAIVLFTDGVDTQSHKSSYDSTVDEAEESDALVFPIYYNTFFENRDRTSSTFPPIFGGGDVYSQRGTSSAEYAVGKQYLTDLATYTGGRVFRPESTPGGLTAAFEGIAEELRRQYNIGYIPTETGKSGQRKQIKVRVDRKNLVIRARDSYIVGGTPVGPDPPKTDK